MPKQIGTINDNGYNAVITEDDSGCVSYKADADIDADGANGQNGQPAAYRVDDQGSDYLANAGMKLEDGKVVCAYDWASDIVILGDDNQPKVFADGVIASKTWYRDPSLPGDNPAAYVDAAVVPYVVVPPVIVQKTVGAVRGCKARVTLNGKSVNCVVADVGPATKIGEISIAAALALGIPPSPRNGGRSSHDVLYEVWPGVAATGIVCHDGKTRNFVLQPA